MAEVSLPKPPAIHEPLAPRLKWRAITLATLILVPGSWALLTGLVAAARNESADAPNAMAALAVGLVVMPFAFVVLAFLSGQPRAPRSVLQAMGISLGVCLLVSVVALDAVTAIVAGTGAGGAVALRAESAHSYRARAIAVFAVALYTFLMMRVVGTPMLLIAPILPFTAIGVADHLTERKAQPRT